jgi:hypothetical protein
MLEIETISDANQASCEVLSDRIAIAVHPEKLEKFSREHAGFYVNYASVVLRTLKRPLFQKFLHWMLRKENIEAQTVRKVEVRVLPFRRRNGNGLAGNCNTYIGKIRIYPKTLKFCQRLIQAFGKDGFASYVRIRARAALIHELLHLKYEKDERKVRELTKLYFSIFARNRVKKDLQVSHICNILFKAEATEKESCRRLLDSSPSSFLTSGVG